MGDPGAPDQLERGFGFIDATMMIMGSMIGSGIFITSAASMRVLPAPGWLLIAWIAAGLLTLTAALCCAELAAMLPQAGGQYVFLREAYGSLVAFLFGWGLFLVIQTGTIAAVAIAFANFLGVFIPTVSSTVYLVNPVLIGRYAFCLSTQQIVAVSVIVLLTFANTRGLELGKWIQNVFTFAKTGALVVLIGSCWLAWNYQAAAFTSPWWRPDDPAWISSAPTSELGLGGAFLVIVLLGRAMVGPMFAQSAWNNITFAAGEVRDPGRNLPRALLLGCGAIVALYVLTNMGYLVCLPSHEIAHAPGDRVASQALRVAWGPVGEFAMAAAIMISTFGCENGLILAGARVYFAMARDRLFFPAVGKINSHRVPGAALWAQGCWAAFLTLPRTVSTGPVTGAMTLGNIYEQLLQYVISVDLVFYGLMVLAVPILRHRHANWPRPFRTPVYPWVPILYVTLAAALIVDLAWLTPWTSGAGYLIVLSGIPAYGGWRWRQQSLCDVS